MVPRQRADADGVARPRAMNARPGMRLMSTRIDGPQQAEIEHRHEALPARDDLGVAPRPSAATAISTLSATT